MTTCFVCNIEADSVFLDEPDHGCSICGYRHLKKSKIPTEHNHEIGYASNYHLQHLTSAEHISICPGQEIYSGSMYVAVSDGYFEVKTEKPCTKDGDRTFNISSEEYKSYLSEGSR